MKSASPPQKAVADVVSEALLYPSRSGLKLSAFWDHRAEGFERCPFVIVAPKYGETKKNNLQLAYLLAANGMNVVRFDHANHVGESAGEKTAFTLPGGVEDILATVDHLVARFGISSVSLLASSLSARTALRAAARDPRIGHLVCIVGVVNVRHTLREVYREDLVANHLAGKTWGVTDILGHEIDFDQFLAHACDSQMHDLEGAARDLAATTIPVTYFSGEEDTWVLFGEVEQVVGRAPRGRVVKLAGAKHEVRENEPVAQKAFNEVVGEIIREAWGLENAPTELRTPDIRQVFAQNRIERARLKKASPTGPSELSFWSDYLRKFDLLGRVEDYCTYLELVGELLGPFKPGERVLDAGCGSGLFGAWLLRNLPAVPRSGSPMLYVGLDLTQHGLAESSAKHTALIAARAKADRTWVERGVDVMYARANFDRIGPEADPREMPRFVDGMFDVICCSLVLSYLVDPSIVLAEFRRLLRPGGRLMVSSMKPHCDMSTIYRDFMDQGVSGTELQSARNLLSAAGQIKLKEEQGYYVFYSGEQLVDMLRAAGFRDMQVFASFGDQAVVVRSSA